MRDTDHFSVNPGIATLLGHAFDETGNAIDDTGHRLPVMPAPIAPLPGDTRAIAGVMQETGISVIDLFAPFARGGVVRLSGSAHVGLLVTLGEWTRRLADRQHGCMVYVSWHEDATARRELLHVWEKQRTTPHIITIFGTAADCRTDDAIALRTAWSIARHLRDDGRDVILAVEITPGFPAVLRQWPWGTRDVRGPITLALVDIAPAGGHGDADREMPVDSHLVFDAALARQKQYPAITPLRSGSRLLASSAVSAQHRQIAAAARALLAQTPPHSASPLWQYLAQPYFIAEPFTGVAGVYRTLAVTLAAVESLLAADTR